MSESRVREARDPSVNSKLQGVDIGSRTRFEQINRALETHGIKPVMDREFPLNDAQAAFQHHNGMPSPPGRSQPRELRAGLDSIYAIAFIASLLLSENSEYTLTTRCRTPRELISLR